MASLQHRRTHNLLLISKLLNQRDAASPFTLVLDSLEQSGKPLLAEFMKRANANKVQVISVSFNTLRKPQYVDFFVEAWRQSLQDWRKEVLGYLQRDLATRKLLVLDNLNSLATNTDLPHLLSSLITATTSLLALYHLDVPLTFTATRNTYAPSPLNLLRYLATTIFTTHSFHHILAKKSARDRSLAEPTFGLEGGVEGVMQGLGANGKEGCVLEMEYRRKSGRGVREWYFLPYGKSAVSTIATSASRAKEIVVLLEDHAQYRTAETIAGGAVTPVANQGETSTTFELGLTERQKRDREGVVLPYFDAQRGGGEGGRILYDLGSEDDFDEDEDEI